MAAGLSAREAPRGTAVGDPNQPGLQYSGMAPVPSTSAHHLPTASNAGVPLEAPRLGHLAPVGSHPAGSGTATSEQLPVQSQGPPLPSAVGGAGQSAYGQPPQGQPAQAPGVSPLAQAAAQQGSVRGPRSQPKPESSRVRLTLGAGSSFRAPPKLASFEPKKLHASRPIIVPNAVDIFRHGEAGWLALASSQHFVPLKVRPASLSSRKNGGSGCGVSGPCRRATVAPVATPCAPSRSPCAAPPKAVVLRPHPWVPHRCRLRHGH